MTDGKRQVRGKPPAPAGTEENDMSITLDIPPAMVQEISVYAEAKGKSLAEVFMELFRKQSEREEAVRRFQEHVDRISSRLKGGEPYRFNRADAYDVSPSGARNHDFP